MVNCFFTTTKTRIRVSVSSVLRASRNQASTRDYRDGPCSCPELVVRECGLMSFMDEIPYFCQSWCFPSFPAPGKKREGFEFSMIICIDSFSSLAHPAGVITGLLKGNRFRQFAKEGVLLLHTFILHKGAFFTTWQSKKVDFLVVFEAMLLSSEKFVLTTRISRFMV